MTIKLYSFPLSMATQSVALTLKEIGVPYEVVDVDLSKGEHKNAEYIENFHPFGQVPVLVDDDGFKLYESRAIARYVIAKYAPDSGLIPKDPKKNALFEQAFSVEVTDFHPFAVGLAGEKFIKPNMIGIPSNEVIAMEATKQLAERLKGYEIILGKQKYLAGDEFTLADLFHLPSGYLITEKVGFDGLKATATPNVARWWADISSRPTWKEISENTEKFLAQLKG